MISYLYWCASEYFDIICIWKYVEIGMGPLEENYVNRSPHLDYYNDMAMKFNILALGLFRLVALTSYMRAYDGCCWATVSFGHGRLVRRRFTMVRSYSGNDRKPNRRCKTLRNRILSCIHLGFAPGMKWLAVACCC